MKNSNDIIPEQQSGGKTDVEESIQLGSVEEASKYFNLVKQRLQDINKWHDFAGALTASFKITDEEGKELPTQAQKGLYIKIDIPAPGPATGKGYDWVRIEEINEGGDDTAERQYFGIRVRPADNPKKRDNNDTAHFFTSEATSSFLVERNGNKVSASVHGRNEKPNTETNKLIDKARNAIIGTGAIAGLSEPQWKALVKGLVSK